MAGVSLSSPCGYITSRMKMLLGSCRKRKESLLVFSIVVVTLNFGAFQFGVPRGLDPFPGGIGFEHGQHGQRHSFHDCAVGTQSCLIRNLCTDESGNFIYYKDPAYVLGKPTSQGFPYGIVQEDMEIHVKTGPIPPIFSRQSEGVYAMMNRYVSGNHGHILGDELVSLFRALRLWGVDGKPLHAYLSPPDDFANNHMYQLLTDVKAARADTFPSSTCFDYFVFGDFRELGFSRPGYQPKKIPQMELLEFRDHVWRRYGITGAGKGSHKAHIVFLEKDLKSADHKFAITNVKQISKMLEKKFDATVTRATWKDMPLKEQVHIMSIADVVITPPGADMMNCVFMPTHSALIAPDRREGSEWYTGDEVRLWFKFLPFRYIVSWSAIEDGESEEKRENYLTLGKSVVAKYVGQALRHLGRHGVVQVAQTSSAQYSSHDCFEEHCLVHSLCFDGGKNRFVYYRDPRDEFETVMNLDGCDRVRYIGNNSNTSSDYLSNTWNGVHIDKVTAPIPVLPSTFKSGVHVRISDGSGAHLGGVVALFRALDMWSLLNDTVVYVHLAPELKQYAYLYRLLNYIPFDVASSSSESHVVCFDKFLFGNFKSLGYSPQGEEPDRIPQMELLRFRDYVWQRYGLRDQQVFPQRAQIVIIEDSALPNRELLPDQDLAIANAGELVSELQMRFGANVTRAKWNILSLREQIEIMSATQVVIAVPGPAIISCLFMPTKSAIIIPDGRVDNHWTTSFEARRWFQYLPYKYIVNFRPEAVEASTVKLSISVVSGYVKQALHHLWLQGIVS